MTFSELWAVSIPVDDHFLRSECWNGDRIILNDSHKISDVFKNVDEASINVYIVGPTFQGCYSHHILRDLVLTISIAPDSFDKKRQACIQWFEDITPSSAAKLNWLKSNQSLLKEDIKCHRPKAQDVTPISLLHPIFGELVDDMNNITPRNSDYKFADELAKSMSKFFETEADRVRKFNAIFKKHGVDIDNSQIASDGGRKHSHLNLVITGGTNGSGMIDSDSFFQVLFYYCKRLASSYKGEKYDVLQNSRRPSISILYNGKYHSYGRLP